MTTRLDRALTVDLDTVTREEFDRVRAIAHEHLVHVVVPQRIGSFDGGDGE